jgi:hypothetical protein
MEPDLMNPDPQLCFSSLMLFSLVRYTACEQKDLTPRESDTDKDRMISYDEFLAETKRDEFEKASKDN